jgi:hypothetical protein
MAKFESIQFDDGEFELVQQVALALELPVTVFMKTAVLGLVSSMLAEAGDRMQASESRNGRDL